MGDFGRVPPVRRSNTNAREKGELLILPLGKRVTAVNGSPISNFPTSPFERKIMRKLVVLASLAVIVLTGFEAQANQRRVRTQVLGGPRPSAVDRTRTTKNAYLRQTFLGR